MIVIFAIFAFIIYVLILFYFLAVDKLTPSRDKI